MTEPIHIPRVLGLPLVQELSILFSDYYANTVKNQNLYHQIQSIPWTSSRFDENGSQLPLIPPNIQPDHVFQSELEQRLKDLLMMQWEDQKRPQNIRDFLNVLYNRPLFNQVYDRLEARGAFDGDRNLFKAYFRQVWFGLYSWDQVNVSADKTCGFRHVYLGEIRRRVVKGLHHWKRFYVLEKLGHLVLRQIHKKHKELPLAAMKFTVDEAVKPYGTILFGIPVELELMIFFCAFLVGPNRLVQFYIDQNVVNVMCYDVATQSDMLATAFFKY